jgi:hypothetical protein
MRIGKLVKPQVPVTRIESVVFIMVSEHFSFQRRMQLALNTMREFYPQTSFLGEAVPGRRGEIIITIKWFSPPERHLITTDQLTAIQYTLDTGKVSRDEIEQLIYEIEELTEGGK